MTEDEPEAGFLAELSLTDEEEGGGRAECAACLRPASACWCRHLPRPRLVTRTRVLVLQHPGEVRRNIRTCRMLELGLAEGCVQVVRGMKRNHDLNHPENVHAIYCHIICWLHFRSKVSWSKPGAGGHAVPARHVSPVPGQRLRARGHVCGC